MFNIRDNEILRAIASNLEIAIVPQLSPQPRMQVVAAVELLRTLALRGKAKDWVYPEEIASLRDLFEDILKSLEAAGEYCHDESVSILKRKIAVALKEYSHASPTHTLEDVSMCLNEVLDFTILTLSKVLTHSSPGPFMDRIKEIKKMVSRFLGAQYELKTNMEAKGKDMAEASVRIAKD